MLKPEFVWQTAESFGHTEQPTQALRSVFDLSTYWLAIFFVPVHIIPCPSLSLVAEETWKVESL